MWILGPDLQAQVSLPVDVDDGLVAAGAVPLQHRRQRPVMLLVFQLSPGGEARVGHPAGLPLADGGRNLGDSGSILLLLLLLPGRSRLLALLLTFGLGLDAWKSVGKGPVNL